MELSRSVASRLFLLASSILFLGSTLNLKEMKENQGNFQDNQGHQVITKQFTWSTHARKESRFRSHMGKYTSSTHRS